MGLGALAYWDCGFESRRVHGCLIAIPEESFRLCVSLCDLETSRMKRLKPAFGRNITGKVKQYAEDCEINHLVR